MATRTMDPVTHTLVGASLGATRLGQRTRYAIPALVIGANLPDIDVASYFAGGDFALGFRRGWTHGVLALVVLPALLALAFLLLDRVRRGKAETDGRLEVGWLFGLCYLATLTHPFLDWLNTYGMRWWMPFRDTWYYGDSVFIMDPWLWLMLGVGWLIGRRATWRLVTVLVSVSALLVTVVFSRAPGYLPAVLVILVPLSLALFWRPPPGSQSPQKAAIAGLSAASLFIASMLLVHQATERRVLDQLEQLDPAPVESLMVGPVPANPARWEFVVEQRERLRHGQFDWIGDRSVAFTGFDRPVAQSSDLWPDIEDSGQSRGFLSWVRFPWIEVAPDPSGSRLHIMDARYSRRRTIGFGGTVITLPVETVGGVSRN